ncbi:MAG: ImmA/IrrE family metallo-endopeptidase [Clostridia bacterium]|nr:ImmA/IrrE family metallo-endopeptidase [Clostridia bacterium]
MFVRYDIKCIPISGFEIAIKMGIKLIPYTSLSPIKREKAYDISEDGFYAEPGDGKEYIFYNDLKQYNRCNMTILHEIGHAVLGHSEDMDHDVVEAEAAFFAKYALAPPPLVNKLHNKSIKSISNTFDISMEAAKYAEEYYQKWLHFGPSNYLDYERVLIRQVKVLDRG